VIDFSKIPWISANDNGKLSLGKVKHKNKNSFEHGISYTATHLCHRSVFSCLWQDFISSEKVHFFL